MKKANFCSNHLNSFHINKKKTSKISAYLNTGLPLFEIEICLWKIFLCCRGSVTISYLNIKPQMTKIGSASYPKIHIHGTDAFMGDFKSVWQRGQQQLQKDLYKIVTPSLFSIDIFSSWT